MLNLDEFGGKEANKSVSKLVKIVLISSQAITHQRLADVHETTVANLHENDRPYEEGSIGPAWQ